MYLCILKLSLTIYSNLAVSLVILDSSLIICYTEFYALIVASFINRQKKYSGFYICHLNIYSYWQSHNAAPAKSK